MIDDDLAAMSIRPPDESEIIPFTPEQMRAMGFTESSSDYEGLFKAVLPVLSSGHEIVVISTEPPGTDFYKHTFRNDGLAEWLNEICGQFDPPPAWYVAPGKRMIPATVKAFVETHTAEIDRVAIAAAERVAPFAVGIGPRFHMFATDEVSLLKWSLGCPYHRGLTEEHFTVAAVTYTASNGRFITVPITFGWETGKVEANFNAKRLGI